MVEEEEEEEEEFARRALRRGNWTVLGRRLGRVRVAKRLASEVKVRRVLVLGPVDWPIRRADRVRDRLCDGDVWVARSAVRWRSSVGCTSQRENRDGRSAIFEGVGIYSLVWFWRW